MNNYEQLISYSLEDLADWLVVNVQFDDSPWITWFDDNFCSKCEAIECAYSEYWNSNEEPYPKCTIKCAYCELEDKCKFFPEIQGIPSNKDIIVMWLKEKANV